jgi:hypothetical protein
MWPKNFHVLRRNQGSLRGALQMSPWLTCWLIVARMQSQQQLCCVLCWIHSSMAEDQLC